MFEKLFKRKKHSKQLGLKKPTVIYQRIENLFKILNKIKEDEKIKNISKYDDYTYRSIKFNFISNYGERKVGIGYNILVYSDSTPKVVEAEYSLDYTIEKYRYQTGILEYGYWEDIFKIKSSEYVTSIEPCFIQNSLTAHDIDMAIYEIEEYIRNKYGTLEEIENYHKGQINILEKDLNNDNI